MRARDGGPIPFHGLYSNLTRASETLARHGPVARNDRNRGGGTFAALWVPTCQAYLLDCQIYEGLGGLQPGQAGAGPVFM